MNWWRWGVIGADTVIAVSMTAAVVLMRPVSGWWVWCLAALLGLPLAFRVVWPAPVLVVVQVAAALTILTGVGTEVSVYAVAYALYVVALAPGHWALPSSLAAVLIPGFADAFLTALPLVPGSLDSETFTNAPVTVTLYSTAIIGGSWALALALRWQREHNSLLADRAIVEERLRIARDVHDVVGHNLSLIAMKAAVANHLETDRKTALDTIEQVSRTTLEEVRAVLGDLRTSTDLDRIVEETRASGVTVTVKRGDMSEVPAGVRASAYWILREALTNVRRHAPMSRCHVTVTSTTTALQLSVVNDGPADDSTSRREGRTRRAEWAGRTDGSGPEIDNGPVDGTGRVGMDGRVETDGFGLVGMGERAASHQGTLTAAPQPGGGFAVRATLRFTT
ncbi:sensor histidine kinase [Actinoplanes sp. G11-F43]|uniref:sensor histidine kinase n=1 Tax=Actinoplanes sp. G11-F43 TaxID=3424130 RepID=UPI003D345DA0